MSRPAADDLLPLVYDELRRIAGRFLQDEPSGHTLQPTALVHEAYLRLSKQTGVDWKSAGHLRALAAQAMRRVLVDHARGRKAAKRGGGARGVTLWSEILADGEEQQVDVLDLEQALEKLAALNERQAKILELRFFGGLTTREVAKVLELSETTVEDHGRIARAWLGRELSRGT